MKHDVLYITEGRMRDGVDGVRDVDAPCEAFRAGEPFVNGVPIGWCQSDGHYICHECKHLHLSKTKAGKQAGMDAVLELLPEAEHADFVAWWHRNA